MKVLVNCTLPFALAHGGQAIQIQRTISALNEIGIEAEPLRWWDESQKGDVIHYFGRMPVDHIQFAHQKNIRVVMAELLTAQGSQNFAQRSVRKAFRMLAENLAPRGFAAAFNWEPYRLADAFIALTPWEKHLMQYKFGADPERIHVVANGVEEPFFQAEKVERGQWLVCTATITDRKRVLELAQAAVLARTPVWIIGKAYSDEEPYAKSFFALAKQQPEYVRYEGPVGDRAKLAAIYRAARGFVLLSSMETRSISAEEAAACECPLLLGDLPWARSVFGRGAQFCPVTTPSKTAVYLRNFYDAAPKIAAPPPPANWIQVARQFKLVYEKVLARPTVSAI